MPELKAETGITHKFLLHFFSLFCTFPRSSVMSSEPLQCMLVSKRSTKRSNPRQFVKATCNPRKQASPRGKRMHFITVWHIPACLSVFNSPWTLPILRLPLTSPAQLAPVSNGPTYFTAALNKWILSIASAGPKAPRLPLLTRIFPPAN